MSLTHLQRRLQNSSLRTGRTAADSLPSSTLPRLLGSRRLSQAAVLTNVINNASSYSQVQGSQFSVLPLCSRVFPLSPFLSPRYSFRLSIQLVLDPNQREADCFLGACSGHRMPGAPARRCLGIGHVTFKELR